MQVEAPTVAAMAAQAGSDDPASQSARALLLPAASIGAPVLVSSGPTLTPVSNGARNDEQLTDSFPPPTASNDIATSQPPPSSSASPSAPAATSTPSAVSSPPSEPAGPDACLTPSPHGIKVAEEKKFFLAARRSEGSMGSGLSSDSPESGSVGSGSGKSGSVGLGRDALVGAMWGREALLAKALAGREAAHGDMVKGMEGVAPSKAVKDAANGATSTSPSDDIRLSSLMKGKARGGPGLGSNGKRKSGLKSDEGLVGEVQGGVKGDVKLEVQRKSAERQYEPTNKGKEKERVVAVGVGETSKGTDPGTSSPRPGLPATRSLQQLPSQRHPHPHGHPHVHPHGHGHANHHGHPYVQPHQSHHLRQLPTNPPRRQHSPARKSAAANKSPSSHSSHGRGNTADSMQSRRHNNDSPQSRPNHSDVSYTRAHPPTPAPAPDGLMTRHLPYHPQLSHLGLGHLPTVPPKPRRPIEITETSSEYETTDTEGEESSWESESFSGEEAGAGARDGSSKHGRIAGDGTTSKNGKGATTSANTQRTRDAGEFARDAALEAQRQRDLFQKLPARSYSNLAQLPRAKSGLSLLFRPDPELFPEGHPYRTSKSSRDLLARTWSAPAPPLAVTALSKRGSPVRPMPAAVNAVPVVASVNSRTSTMGATGGSTERYSGSGGLQRGGYRPRAKPADQEEETDSGEDDPDDAIQLSSSVAQRRLAALMGRRGTQSQQHLRHPSSLHATSSPPASALANQASPPSMPRPVTRTTTAPVLMHPYLPDPAPLQTPHTVRRNIISQELDEELRRNLLWERSQNQIQGRPPRAAGSILPGPWRRMASSRPEEEPSGESQSQTNEDRAPGRRPFGTQRTKSWAGDFHASGCEFVCICVNFLCLTTIFWVAIG